MKKLRTLLPAIPACIALLALSGSAIVCVADEQANGNDATVLQFRPPANSSLRAVQKQVMTDHLCTVFDKGKPRKDSIGLMGQVESETIARQTVKETAQGYSLTTKVLKSSAYRLLAPNVNPKLKIKMEDGNAPAGSTLRYEVDKDGKLLGIYGYDALIKKISAASNPTADPELAKALAPLFQEKDWKTYGEAEWNSQMLLNGRSLPAIASTWHKMTAQSFEPGLLTTFSTTVRAIERLQFKGRDCLKLRFYSQPADAGQTKALLVFVRNQQTGKDAAMKELLPKEMAGKGLGATTFTQVEVIVTGEQIIDLKTLIVLSSTTKRTIKKWYTMNEGLPGEPLPNLAITTTTTVSTLAPE